MAARTLVSRNAALARRASVSLVSGLSRESLRPSRSFFSSTSTLGLAPVSSLRLSSRGLTSSAGEDAAPEKPAWAWVPPPTKPAGAGTAATTTTTNVLDTASSLIEPSSTSPAPSSSVKKTGILDASKKDGPAILTLPMILPGVPLTVEDVLRIMEYFGAEDIKAQKAAPGFGALYFVYVTARSTAHARRLCHEVLFCLKDRGLQTFNPAEPIEGEDSEEWMLIDTGNICISVFDADYRARLELELHHMQQEKKAELLEAQRKAKDQLIREGRYIPDFEGEAAANAAAAAAVGSKDSEAQEEEEAEDEPEGEEDEEDDKDAEEKIKRMNL